MARSSPDQHADTEVLLSSIRHLRSQSEAKAVELYWNERRVARSTRRLAALLNRLRKPKLRIYPPDASHG